MRTVGASPKVVVPTGILVAVGAVLMILDALNVIDIPDEVWITLLGAGGVTGVAGYSADPGTVVRKTGADWSTHVRDERGLTSVEVIGLLTLAAVVALLVILLT